MSTSRIMTRMRKEFPDEMNVRKRTRTFQGKPLYKVLNELGESCHGGYLKWSLPTKDADGESWAALKAQTVTGPIACCDNGLHLTTVPMHWPHRHMRVFTAVGNGQRDPGADNKIAFRSVQLLEEVSDAVVPTWFREGDAWLDELLESPIGEPDDHPLPDWYVTERPTTVKADEETSEWTKSWLDRVLVACRNDAVGDKGTRAAVHYLIQEAGDLLEHAAIDAAREYDDHPRAGNREFKIDLRQVASLGMWSLLFPKLNLTYYEAAMTPEIVGNVTERLLAYRKGYGVQGRNLTTGRLHVYTDWGQR